jgi:hypothetical protein
LDKDNKKTANPFVIKEFAEINILFKIIWVAYCPIPNNPY